MASLLELQTAILDVSKNHYIQTSSDISLTSRINAAVKEIAGGIRLPDGQISSPLPELYSFDTVATATDAAYESLPDTYQRNAFLITDSDGNKINPPRGGDYYAFMLFLRSITNRDLSESGSVYRVCVKGLSLYYQGIPAVSTDLTVHFYRLPVDMAKNTSTPDGIPLHLQMNLIKNKVGYELASTMVDGTERMANYHEREFYKALTDLQDFIGIDAEPMYIGSNNECIDLGICD